MKKIQEILNKIIKQIRNQNKQLNNNNNKTINKMTAKTNKPRSHYETPLKKRIVQNKKLANLIQNRTDVHLCFILEWLDYHIDT